MKILFALTYYRPYWTGLTQYAARVAEGLVKRGYEVRVICTQHEKKLPLKETINGVKVLRVPSIVQISRSPLSPLFVFKFAQLALESKAIIVYFPMAELIFLAMLAEIFKRKLFLVHNGDLVLPKGFLNRFLEKIFYVTTSWAIRLSDKVIILTEDYSRRSKLLSRFKSKWKVILPPCSIGSAPANLQNRFKTENNLMGKKLIGFCGRFVEEKGVDFLLEAIPKVLSKVPNAHFVFAGDYKIPYEKFWERIEPLVKKNKNHLALLGLIEDRMKLGAFYSSLDVLVLPSRTDCFPFAQVEALLSGTPIVCTDIPGARWVVKNTGMGLLVKPKSPSALARGIVEVLKNQRKYLRPEEEIRRIFNYKKSIDDFEKLIKN